MANSTRKNELIIFILALLVIGAIIFFGAQQKPNPDENNNDGTTHIIDGWVATTAGVTYQYPPTIPTKYVSLVDWPPAVQVTNEPFSCTKAGNAIDRAGATETRTINGHSYCVTMVSEGAAGSTYNQYAYAFEKDANTVILTFTLRFPQCYNYDDPLRTECQTEQSTFNVDSLIDQVAQTLQ